MTFTQTWTAADLDNLRRDVLAGFTNRQIAEKHNRTIDAVKQQCKRQGLVGVVTRPSKRTKWTEARDAQLRELVASGLNDEQIAEEMDDRREAVQSRREYLRLRLVQVPQPKVTTQRKPGPRPEIHRFDKRLAAMITRIEAPVPSGALLGETVTVLGRELIVIATNPDGELVTVDTVTRDVVVVANPDGDVVAVVRELGIEVVVVRQS